MKKVFFILLIILLSIMWTSGLVEGKIPRKESDALRTLYIKTDGRHWKNKENWNEAPGTEKRWFGITCNAENTTVLKIELINNNLKGTLPPELGDLSKLKTLVLSDNQLKGGHSDLGRLSQLTTLDLSNNELSGDIPLWIGSLTDLKKLNLSNNRLTGAIPSWIEKLENLEELLLDGNRLEGPIPPALGNLTNLTVLRLGHNRLKGKIPSEIRNLTNLANNKSNFKWNALYTDDNNVFLRGFLRKIQDGKDWESTQTIAPKGITAFSLSKTSIKIKWKRIAYTGDSGGYQVFYSATPGGPYVKADGATDDKIDSELEVKRLKQKTTYYFVVQTRTTPHGSNQKNTVYSEYSKEVYAITQGITIYGSVTTSKGEGVEGVEMTASNKGGSAITDSDGKYKLGVTSGWSGTVTPSKKGYDFSRTGPDYYYGVEKDQPNQHYTATPNTIVVVKVTGEIVGGIAGVILTFSNAEGIFTATTDKDGKYSHIVTYNWKGTVTPSKAGYKFKQEKITYPNKEYPKGITGKVIQNIENIPPKISGNITKKGDMLDVIEGVTLTFSTEKEEGIEYSKKAQTDNKGYYSKPVPNNWSGSVTPAKNGYIFDPEKRRYDKITADITDGNFKAELDLKFFISVTGNYMFPSEGNFKEYYGKGIFDPEIKTGYKFYKGFYVWGGFGFSSKSGETRVFKEPIKWRQNFLSLGLGYNGNISTKLGYKAEVGAFYVRYSEEAFDEKSPGKAVGVRLNGAGIFKISDRFFTEISMGYLFASDKIENISIKLGGLKGGLGIGFRF